MSVWKTVIKDDPTDWLLDIVIGLGIKDSCVDEAIINIVIAK